MVRYSGSRRYHIGINITSVNELRVKKKNLWAVKLWEKG